MHIIIVIIMDMII